MGDAATGPGQADGEDVVGQSGRGAQRLEHRADHTDGGGACRGSGRRRICTGRRRGAVPDGTILDTVTPPQTGWLRLGRSGLIHPTNTGNVAILLVGIDAQDHTTNVVLLLPGDSLDWYRIDGSATDTATCTTYPQTGGPGPRPGDVAELTHVVSVSPQL
ncbi:hypothetical protein AB5J56_00590 [Streptomyces sp. R21]|uniref:Uncharacterized protein n=1 Tax=Streptomyces sp. R21 TaxID=3238627 RepID=A0AB39NX91_9ACTN